MNGLFPRMIASAALVAAACSIDDSISAETSGTTPVAVEIKGTNPAGLSSASFAISDLRVRADGTQLPVSIDRPCADLAANQALSAGFKVPDDAGAIEVVVGFDDFGGFEDGTGRTGDIDVRGTNVRFEWPAAELATSGRALVAIDLGRSLVATRPERRLFVPHFDVKSVGSHAEARRAPPDGEPKRQALLRRL